MDCSVVDVEDISKNNIITFPNPTNNLLNIESSKSVESVQFYDVLGRLVLERNGIEDKICQVDVSALETGIYQLLVDGLEIEKVVVID